MFIYGNNNTLIKELYDSKLKLEIIKMELMIVKEKNVNTGCQIEERPVNLKKSLQKLTFNIFFNINFIKFQDGFS